ncbi:MAG: polysaccharide deacetylase [Firmicutes bacterium]|nr:polysaccharide deacetylase [Bacillota bacterium]
MLSYSTFFSTICRIFVVIFLFSSLSPLAVLAWDDENIPDDPDITTLASQVGIPKTKVSPPPNVCYLSDIPTVPQSGIALYDALTLPQRQKAGLPLGLPQVAPYYGQKVVYLTFDDGPDPDITPLILDILTKENVKATFFVVGTQAEKYPAILRRIFHAGHAIGNHSYNHVYRDLYHSTNSFTSQLQHTDEIIKGVIGVRPVICRAPGGTTGTFSKEYWNALSSQGYKEVGWNIESGDASHTKADKLITNITNQITKHSFLWSHSIVLMHDGRGHSETLKALPDIITFFKTEGFEFRVVTLETPPAW